MAKKVQGTHVEHKVTTKGLKEVERDAKKAGKGFNTLDKNARSADRGMKGASQMSSSATKNFSKMSQGITGGLVPAYATLAANLFALDAVFRFLKDSADFRVLTQGQLAFAAATGVAYQSLARDLQAATNNMINFRDAAQAGAIGRAAGLSAGQLTELAEAARTVSIALGRDVTDSFNRLVRGVTKAEPELLDELGIILRLEEATTKYAASLGLNKNQLSIYQKSQAVVNEVLGQAESKFGKINAIMEIQDNSISQLGIAFQEAIDNLRPFIAGFAEFFARFGKNNIDVLTFAIIGFAGGIIKSVIPATHELRKAEAARSAAFIAEQEQIKIKLEEVRQKKLQLANTPIAQQNFGLFAQQQGLTFGGTAGERLARGEALSGQQIGNLKSQLKRKGGPIGAFKGLSGKQQTIAEQLLDDMKADGGKMSKASRLRFEELGLEFDELKLKGKKTTDSLVSGFERFAGGAMRALSVISTIVAVGSILFMIGKSIYNFIRRDEIKRTEQFNDKLGEATDSASRLNTELMKMSEVSRKGLLDPGAETDIFLGSAVESADLQGRIRSLEELRQQSNLNSSGFAEFQNELTQTFTSLGEIDSRFIEFGDTLRKGNALTDEQRDRLKALTDSILTVKAAQDTLKQTTGELIKAQNRLIQSLPKVPYQDIIELLRTNQKAYTDLVKEGLDYELHLERVNNQLKIFELFQTKKLKLEQRSRELGMDQAMGFLAGNNEADRQLKVKQAELKLDQEIHKLNELQLNIQEAALEQDDAKLRMLQQQRDTQIAMIGDAKALVDLEKVRADRMAMTYNDMYKNIERDLGAAIGAGLRGDSSGFAKIGENMVKTITDSIGQFLSEQFIEDIMPEGLKPKSVGEEIQEAGNKHAEEVKEAIESGAIIHGNVLKGEHQTLERILNEQNELNARIADKEAAAKEAEVIKKQKELDVMEMKTDAKGILKFMETPQFKQEAMDHEISTRSIREQRNFNTNRQAREAAQRELDTLFAALRDPGVSRSDIALTRDKEVLSHSNMSSYTVDEEVTFDRRIKELQDRLQLLDKNHTKMLGDYLKDYEEFLMNSTTSAIENVTDMEGDIEGLKTEAKLKRDKATAFRKKVGAGDDEDPITDINLGGIQATGTGPIYFDPATGQVVMSVPNLAGRLQQSLGLPTDPLDPNFNTITPATGDSGTPKNEKNMDEFSKNLNQFSGVIGMMGALTGEEEKTAKIMAKVAKIQLAIAMYERAEQAFSAGGGPLKILSSFIFGTPSGRQGGIMSKHGRSYSHGGIADGPSSGYGAVLHGREAVVPLPNGRTIPVEMAGGSGSTNNTNITVNIDETGTTSSVDSEGGAELGAAINMAVQAELERQMRPGGILGS